MVLYKISLGDVELDDDAPVVWPFQIGGQSPSVSIFVNSERFLEIQKKVPDQTELTFSGPPNTTPGLVVNRIGIIKQA